MMNNTVISTIIPVYNAGKFLAECIESILQQTFRDFELILIDDGSSDNSGAICDDYQRKDDRIKVVHKKNGGVSSARNEGLNIASGRYISFVDADDKTERQFLERLLNALTESDADLAICGYSIIEKASNGKAFTTCKCSTDFSGTLNEFFADIPFYLDRVLIQGPCNKLFKAEILRGGGLRFSPELSFGEDTDFVYEYLAHVKKIVSVKESLYYYNRTVDGTLCSTFRKDKVNVWFNNFDKLYQLIHAADAGLAETYRRDFERCKCFVFNDCMRELYMSRPNINKQDRIRQIEFMLSTAIMILNIT